MGAAYVRKYNAAATIGGITLRTAGTGDIRANPTLASGDVKLSKDGGAFANLGTLPSAVPASGKNIEAVLTGTELSCARAVIHFIDQTAPKEWDDFEIVIETFGNASAQFPPDYGNATNQGMSNLDATISSRMATFTLPTNFATLSVDGTGKVALASAQAFNNTGTWTGSLTGSVGTVGGQTLANLDAAVSTRLPTSSYVGPGATWYVRTDGNDTNTGKGNDSAHAFLTVAHAASAAASGDTIVVGAGTFAEGNNQVNLSGTGSGGIHLRGAGVDVTIITSTIDAVATNHACVKAGDNSDVGNLTISGIAGAGIFQTPFGSLSADSIYVNARLHDAKLTADSDGINTQAGCVTLAERVTFSTKFDANTAVGQQLELRNCIVIVNGPSSIGVSNRADGCFCFSTGRLIAIDTTFTIVQGPTATGIALGISTSGTSVATLIGCALSATNQGSGSAFDLQQSGSSIIRVDASTTYATHSGTITPNPATLVPHAGTITPGATVTGAQTGVVLTGASIATHVNYDNAIALLSFSQAGAVWSAIVPSDTPVGTYSVRVTDGTNFYYVGTTTVGTTQAAGDGDTIVNQDTGGTDNLRFTTAGGAGIDNALVIAFLKSEYDAGATTATRRAQVFTKADGRWVQPMLLNKGLTYKFVFSASGFQSSVVEQAV